MASWLQKQKKADLVELADEAGLAGAAAMKKDDLATELDQLLRANQTTLSKKSIFDSFYSRTSPAKPAATADADSKPAKPRQRRITKAPSELAAEASSEVQAAVARTPKTVQRAASRVPLPSSPSAVTDLVERQTTAITREVSKYWRASGLTPYFEGMREVLSSVVGIATCLIILEAWGLQRVTLPWREAFKLRVAFAKTFGLSSLEAYQVSFPDFFVFLTSAFWGPSLLWSITSILAPAGMGWMFNLTIPAGKRRAYEVDPLVFFLSKAVLTWLVYAQGFRLFGLAPASTSTIVSLAMPGGWFGIVIGSLLGAVISLYEAVLRK